MHPTFSIIAQIDALANGSTLESRASARATEQTKAIARIKKTDGRRTPKRRRGRLIGKAADQVILAAMRGAGRCTSAALWARLCKQQPADAARMTHQQVHGRLVLAVRAGRINGATVPSRSGPAWEFWSKS